MIRGSSVIFSDDEGDEVGIANPPANASSIRNAANLPEHDGTRRRRSFFDVELPCPRCTKVFKSQLGLKIHLARNVCCSTTKKGRESFVAIDSGVKSESVASASNDDVELSRTNSAKKGRKSTKSTGTRGRKKSPTRTKSSEENESEGSSSSGEDMEPPKSTHAKNGGKNTPLRRRTRSLSQSFDKNDSDESAGSSKPAAEKIGRKRTYLKRRTNKSLETADTKMSPGRSKHFDANKSENPSESDEDVKSSKPTAGQKGTHSQSSSSDGSVNESSDSDVESPKPAAGTKGRKSTPLKRSTRSKSLDVKSENSGSDEDIRSSKPAPANRGRWIGTQKSAGNIGIKKTPGRLKSLSMNKSESVRSDSDDNIEFSHTNKKSPLKIEDDSDDDLNCSRKIPSLVKPKPSVKRESLFEIDENDEVDKSFLASKRSTGKTTFSIDRESHNADKTNPVAKGNAKSREHASDERNKISKSSSGDKHHGKREPKPFAIRREEETLENNVHVAPKSSSVHQKGNKKSPGNNLVPKTSLAKRDPFGTTRSSVIKDGGAGEQTMKSVKNTNQSSCGSTGLEKDSQTSVESQECTLEGQTVPFLCEFKSTSEHVPSHNGKPTHPINCQDRDDKNGKQTSSSPIGKQISSHDSQVSESTQEPCNTTTSSQKPIPLIPVVKASRSSVPLVKSSKKTRRITPKKAETKTPIKRKSVDGANDNNRATAGPKKSHTSLPSDAQRSSAEKMIIKAHDDNETSESPKKSRESLAAKNDAHIMLPAEKSVGGEQSACGSKMRSCPLCFRTFTSLAGFKYHTSKKVCSQQKPAATIEGLTCKVCSKIFDTKLGYNYHKKNKICRKTYRPGVKRQETGDESIDQDKSTEASSNEINGVNEKSDDKEEVEKPPTKKRKKTPPTASCDEINGVNEKSDDKEEVEKPPTKKRKKTPPTASCDKINSVNEKSDDKEEVEKPPTKKREKTPPTASCDEINRVNEKSDEKEEVEKPPTNNRKKTPTTRRASSIEVDDFPKNQLGLSITNPFERRNYFEKLKPGSLHITKFGIVKVIADDRSPAGYAPNKLSRVDHVKRYDQMKYKYECKQRAIAESIYSGGRQRREQLKDMYLKSIDSANHTSNTEQEASAEDNTRKNDASVTWGLYCHSISPEQILHDKLTWKDVNGFPHADMIVDKFEREDIRCRKDYYPDRIVECVLVGDKRKKVFSNEIDEQIGNLKRKVVHHQMRLFLARKELVQRYDKADINYICSTCRKSFGYLDEWKDHVDNDRCTVELKLKQEHRSRKVETREEDLGFANNIAFLTSMHAVMKPRQDDVEFGNPCKIKQHKKHTMPSWIVFNEDHSPMYPELFILLKFKRGSQNRNWAGKKKRGEDYVCPYDVRKARKSRERQICPIEKKASIESSRHLHDFALQQAAKQHEANKQKRKTKKEQFEALLLTDAAKIHEFALEQAAKQEEAKKNRQKGKSDMHFPPPLPHDESMAMPPPLPPVEMPMLPDVLPAIPPQLPTVEMTDMFMFASNQNNGFTSTEMSDVFAEPSQDLFDPTEVPDAFEEASQDKQGLELEMLTTSGENSQLGDKQTAEQGAVLHEANEGITLNILPQDVVAEPISAKAAAELTSASADAELSSANANTRDAGKTKRKRQRKKRPLYETDQSTEPKKKTRKQKFSSAQPVIAGAGDRNEKPLVASPCAAAAAAANSPTDQTKKNLASLDDGTQNEGKNETKDQSDQGVKVSLKGRVSAVPVVIDTQILVAETDAGRYPTMSRYDGLHFKDCILCTRKDSDEEDPLIECDFCKNTIHQICLGKKMLNKDPPIIIRELEPHDSLMCHDCMMYCIARRARAESRRVSKWHYELSRMGLTHPEAANLAQDVDMSNSLKNPEKAEDDSPTYSACPIGGPGGLICCSHCTSAYSRSLSNTAKEMEAQSIAKAGQEVNEILDLLTEAKQRLLSATDVSQTNEIRRKLLRKNEV